jgi:MFS family permease
MKEATARSSLFLVVVGITATITQGFLVRKLLKTTPEVKLLRAGLAIVACSLLAIPILGNFGIFPLFLLTGASLALGSGLYNPSMAGLVSLSSPSDKQGFGLAINQSAAALGRVIGPTTAGILFAANESSPFVAGGALTLVAIVVLGKGQLARNS